MTTPQETIARILDRWQLDALTAAGFAVVPVEPTEEMWHWNGDWGNFVASYQAMLRAVSIAASGEGKP